MDQENNEPKKLKRPPMPGAGRPRGTITEQTRLKIEADKQIRKIIYQRAKKFVDAQSIVALGTHRMIVITKDELGIPHVQTIRDEERMDSLLNEGKYGVDYFIVVGAEPDWKAANALLDRGFGKAKESVEHSGEVKFSLKELAERRTISAEQLEELEDEDIPALPSEVVERQGLVLKDAVAVEVISAPQD